MRSHLACSLITLLFAGPIPAVAQVVDEGAGTDDTPTDDRPAPSTAGPAWLGVMLQS